MRHSVVFYLALMIPLVSCATQSQLSDADTTSNYGSPADKFVGSWTLISFKDEPEEGEAIYPFGQDAFGRIVYESNGKMAVVLMQPGREAPHVESSFEELSPEEMRSVLSGFFAYTGDYSVNERDQTITHHIEACLAPTWVGSDRIRKYQFISEDRISLQPKEGTSELIWQREH